MPVARKHRPVLASGCGRLAIAALAAVAAVLLLDIDIVRSAAAAGEDQPSSGAAVREIAAPVDATARGDAKASDDVIIATFPLAAPLSLEEEVARTHGLQVLDRRNLKALGRRIVRFRVLNGQPVTGVLAGLRADQRVGSAQANLWYRLPSEPPAQSSPPVPAPPAVAAGKSDTPRQALAPPRRRSLKNATATKAQPARPISPMPAAGNDFLDMRKAQAGRANGVLANGSRTALRWPTADEPFVNVGPSTR